MGGTGKTCLHRPARVAKYCAFGVAVALTVLHMAACVIRPEDGHRVSFANIVMTAGCRSARYRESAASIRELDVDVVAGAKETADFRSPVRTADVKIDRRPLDCRVRQTIRLRPPGRGGGKRERRLERWSVLLFAE